MKPNISAILLAAGESKRMGNLKQLLPFGPSTVIETCIGNLLSSNASEVIVVLGHRADEIRQVIDKFPVNIVLNEEFKQGMSSSIKAGVRTADPESAAFLFALVDQPLIGPGIINHVIDNYTAALSSGKKIVIPRYQDKGGHPSLFDASLRDEIQNIDSGIGLKQVKNDHLDKVLYLDVDNPAVVEDMDFREDYLRQLSRLDGNSGF
ncbi:MAG TPA: nucleotidyltransferase family protein [Blastocatellia bacterium]|nr:nucleotidyltransferase family protein [Blastocatellia bacterium]